MKKSLADALFPRSRQAVLGLLFSNPEDGFHVREIARLTHVSAPAISSELENLSATGVVVDKRQGNMRIFRANRDCPLFEELRGIAIKTLGIADLIRHALLQIDGVDVAFIFGSVARKEEHSGSDVDVMVIGSCDYTTVARTLYNAGKELNREVNAQVYSREEFNQKIQEENPFVMQVLEGKKIVLKGDERGLYTGGE